MHGEEGHWSGRDQSNAVSSQAMLRITGNHQKLVSLVAHMVKSLPAKQEGQIWSLSQEDTWRREWQPTPVSFLVEFHEQRTWWATVHRVKKVGHNWVANTSTFFFFSCQKLGKWKVTDFQRLQKERILLASWFQTSILLNCERINFCCLGPFSLCNLLRQP